MNLLRFLSVISWYFLRNFCGSGLVIEAMAVSVARTMIAVTVNFLIWVFLFAIQGQIACRQIKLMEFS